MPRWLVGGTLVVTLSIVLAGVLLYGSMHRLSGWLGARNAILWRAELGLRLGQAHAGKTLLLAGDSRLAMLDGPLIEAGRWHEVNVAIGGSTAAHWHQMLADRSNGACYDAAFLWAGINDLMHQHAPAEATVEHVVAVALRLRDYAQRVFLLEQIPVRLAGKEDFSRTLSARVVEVNRGLHERLAGEPNVIIIATHDALRAPDGLLERWCSDDGLHLNEKGQAWLRQRIGDPFR